MKRRILSLVMALVMSFSCTLVAFADSGANKKTSETSNFSFIDANGITEDVETRTSGDKVTVKVYIGNKLNHTAIVNHSTGEIVTEKATGEKSYSKLKDYLTDSLSPIVPEINTPISILSIVPGDPSGFGDGYIFGESHFSPGYQMYGNLYSKYLGSQGRTIGKRVSVTKGTLVGTLIGILGAFIAGPITITSFLVAVGSGVIGGIITNAIDSKVCFDYMRTNYRVRSNGGIIALDTYIKWKYEVIYNYITQKEKYISMNFSAGFAGSKYEMIETGCSLYRLKYGY